MLMARSNAAQRISSFIPPFEYHVFDFKNVYFFLFIYTIFILNLSLFMVRYVSWFGFLVFAFLLGGVDGFRSFEMWKIVCLESSAPSFLSRSLILMNMA